MPVAYLDVTAELLTGLLKGFSNGPHMRFFSVDRNGLPEDSVCVGMTYLSDVEAFRLHIQSETVTEGEILPPVWLCSHEISRMTVNHIRELHRLPAVERGRFVIDGCGCDRELETGIPCDRDPDDATKFTCDA